MTNEQEARLAQLVHMGYQPVIWDTPTNGSVRAVVARKLDGAGLRLLITPVGVLYREDAHETAQRTRR